MAFKIPFTFSSTDKLKKRSVFLKQFIKHKKNSKLQNYLTNTGIDISREEYLAICIRDSTLTFIAATFLSGIILFFSGIGNYIIIALSIGLVLATFVYISQITYPKLYASRKQREIERNLISALEDMLVQLNAGIPLFSILVNISSSEYGALTEEFKKIVRKINAGMPQVDVLEEIGDKNSSVHFRRTLWQISNGMRAGSDISIIIKESINSLEEEQLIQIQTYGNKLNPIIMFYMLISVVIPALSITFLTIISSLVNLEQKMTTYLFIGLFVFVIIIQTMFLGIIKSLRPSLL